MNIKADKKDDLKKVEKEEKTKKTAINKEKKPEKEKPDKPQKDDFADFPEHLDPHILGKLDDLVNESNDSRIVILLSGHSPFMGQTTDIDGYFLKLIMKRFNLKSRKEINLLFSPASMFPDDQKNYFNGFRDYYKGKLGVNVEFFKFDAAYYLTRIETLLSMLTWMFKFSNDSNRAMILTRIGTECLSYSMGVTEYIYKRVNGLKHSQALEVLIGMAGQGDFFKIPENHNSEDGPEKGTKSSTANKKPFFEPAFDNLSSAEVHRELTRNVFLRLADRENFSNGHARDDVYDSAYQFLEDQMARFNIMARHEYEANKEVFSRINGFYGGGGYTQSLLNAYDRKVGSRDHWHLFKKAMDRGVPFLGYSAHAILFSINDHSIIPYNDSNRNVDYMNMLLEEHDIVIPRKRDFFTVSPMKGLVPLSIIVHYERQVADLRKFELNYFDETVSEDVMSLRNNCAVMCFVRKDFSARIMGVWSKVKPPYGDTTSEIRYIHYHTGKPCKLSHGEIRTISTNPALPHLASEDRGY